MLKTTKRYVITSNILNSYKFRVLTEGIDWTQYYNNPIMLYAHFRATGRNKDEVLPLGNVKEIEIDAEGIVTGRLYFNEKDPFAVKIHQMYEDEILNMLSIGVEPLEWSEDPEDMLPGQLYATVSKSIAKEVSCVDIGANADACGVALYNDLGQMIKLSDGLKTIPTQKQVSNMKITTLSAPAILTLLSLSDTATETDAVTAIQNLVTLAANQKTTITTLQDEKKTAEDASADLQKKLNDQVELALKDKVENLVQGAVDARKITKDEKEGYVNLALKDFENVEKILGLKTGSPSVIDHLNGKKDATADKLAKLCAMSYDDLFESGELSQVKLSAPDEYKRIFKDKFNRDPKN